MKSPDWWLVSGTVLLMSVSTVILYSLNQTPTSDSLRFEKQLAFIVLSLVTLGITSQINYRRILQYAYIGYLVWFLVLIAVLIFGTTVNGTTGWFQLAGISIQPVEFAKIAFILAAARFLADNSFNMEKWGTVARFGAMFGLYFATVLLQPDLGSALILGGIASVMGLATSIRPRQLLLIGGVALLVGVLSFSFYLDDFQKNRLLTFVNPENDPAKSGYNVRQAIISVGSGEWFGRGLGLGPQSQLSFLPERETDFIFAVIGEELGFIGAGTVVLIFAAMIWRLWRLSRELHDDVARYIVIGYVAMLFGQVLINIGMNIGVMPVTGIPLPFISAGGSSLLAMSFGLGITLNALTELKR
ncbi:MAG: FtsW/RodA/SpoVE family cell cycle protein [Patescibacteria group bacterium]|jgi:rod shape determining protein RodA